MSNLNITTNAYLLHNYLNLQTKSSLQKRLFGIQSTRTCYNAEFTGRCQLIRLNDGLYFVFTYKIYRVFQTD
jgi:hypothetical protein